MTSDGVFIGYADTLTAIVYRFGIELMKQNMNFTLDMI